VGDVELVRHSGLRVGGCVVKQTPRTVTAICFDEAMSPEARAALLGLAAAGITAATGGGAPAAAGVGALVGGGAAVVETLREEPGDAAREED
jgi:hypothetical protein